MQAALSLTSPKPPMHHDRGAMWLNRATVCYTVVLPGSAGGRLLAALEGALQAQGCHCAVDTGKFTLAATVTMPALPIPSRPKSEGSPRAAAATVAGEGDAVADNSHERVNGVRNGIECNTGRSMGAKDDSSELVGISAASGQHDVADEAGTEQVQRFDIRMMILQQAVGHFMVKASVASDSSVEIFQHFRVLMETVQSDVNQILC